MGPVQPQDVQHSCCQIWEIGRWPAGCVCHTGKNLQVTARMYTTGIMLLLGVTMIKVHYDITKPHWRRHPDLNVEQLSTWTKVQESAMDGVAS